MTAPEFQQVRTFLTRLVNQLNFSNSTYRLGLAQYGQDIKVEFLFKDYQSREDIRNAIKRFRQDRLQPSEPRNLGNALSYAQKNLFTAEAGSRNDQSFRQYLVVLTGKDSDDPVYQEARRLQSAGIIMVSFSAGALIKDQRVISTQAYFYPSLISGVPNLKTILEKQEEVLPVTDGEVSRWDRWDHNSRPLHPERVSFNHFCFFPDCRSASIADIVFIIDESGSIGRSNFQLVRTFLHTLISGLQVSSNRVRVGIVVYHGEPTAEVFLDTFTDKSELLDFIKILPYTGGGTKTGAALDFAKQKVFVREKGSRKEQGVQQVAVVITDGKSQDDVSDPAADLRRAGVTVFAVGVKDADKAQLAQIASYPTSKHTFMVDSFSKLKVLESSLQRILCQNVIQQAFSVKTRRMNIKEGTYASTLSRRTSCLRNGAHVPLVFFFQAACGRMKQTSSS